jgi:2-polyprenyl-3-methyl-5-hydroxy-6-metoxy-1,4-benzoquinol methylase
MRFSEEDIRPRIVQEKFLNLAREDIARFFHNPVMITIKCYACNQDLNFSFIKHGFQYSDCKECGSIFVNPRPTIKYFNDYYKNSESSRFWASSLFKITKENRTKLIWIPRVIKLKNILNNFNLNFENIIDIGAGYGLFLDIAATEFNSNLIAIEPAPHLARIILNSGHKVIEKFIEEININELPSTGKLFVSFEMFEHLHDPSYFLEKIYSLMNEGDCFFFTTLSSFGIDIQLLWENSESLSPPHHLNFFNPKSIEKLILKNGFKIKKIETPGVLDIDILSNNISKIKDPYWRIFISSLNKKSADDFQEIIVNSKMSSHMMVLIEK